MFSKALKEKYFSDQINNKTNSKSSENQLLFNYNESSSNNLMIHKLLLNNYLIYIKSFNGITFSNNTYLKLKHMSNSHYIDNFDMINPYKISFEEYIKKYQEKVKEFEIKKNDNKNNNIENIDSLVIQKDKTNETMIKFNNLSDLENESIIIQDLMKNNNIDYRYYKYNLIKAKRYHLFNAIKQAIFNDNYPIFIGR